MKPETAISGSAAENAAKMHLERHGLKLLERNFRCRRGEIDLIMRDGAGLVFVEVRYRRQNRFGSALESVTPAKQARIVAAARYYLQQSSNSAPCRFDVIGISGENGNRINWVRDAFRVEP